MFFEKQKSSHRREFASKWVCFFSSACSSGERKDRKGAQQKLYLDDYFIIRDVIKRTKRNQQGINSSGARLDDVDQKQKKNCWDGWMKQCKEVHKKVMWRDNITNNWMMRVITCKTNDLLNIYCNKFIKYRYRDVNEKRCRRIIALFSQQWIFLSSDALARRKNITWNKRIRSGL